MAGSDYKGRVFNLPLFYFFLKKMPTTECLQNVDKIATGLHCKFELSNEAKEVEMFSFRRSRGEPCF